MDHQPKQLHIVSLCSGGAGLDLGIELALGSTRTICWVEWEAYAINYLASYMEAGVLAKAPVWSDLRTFDGRPWCGLVDGICAGYPCQPFSLAGNRRGSDDPRHLWPHVCRIIGEIKPAFVFLENVSGHLSLGFDQVVRDLEALGYKVAAGLFTAAEVGATHKRERLFILAVGNAERGGLASRNDNGPRAEESRTGCDRVGDEAVAHAQDIDGGSRVSSSQEGTRPSGIGRGRLTGSGENVADASGERLQGGQRSGAHGGGGQEPHGSAPQLCPLPLFPPGPEDLQRWEHVLNVDAGLAPAQSKVRLLADGLAHDRPQRLKLYGNGVVPLEAAYAFCSLWAAIRF